MGDNSNSEIISKKMNDSRIEDLNTSKIGKIDFGFLILVNMKVIIILF